MSQIKIDLKKELKPYYKAPSDSPEYIDVPEFQYLMIDGKGDPGKEAFSDATQALYGVTYWIALDGFLGQIDTGRGGYSFNSLFFPWLEFSLIEFFVPSLTIWSLYCIIQMIYTQKQTSP